MPTDKIDHGLLGPWGGDGQGVPAVVTLAASPPCRPHGPARLAHPLEVRARVQAGVAYLDETLRDPQWDLGVDLLRLNMGMPIDHPAHLLTMVRAELLPVWLTQYPVDLVRRGFALAGGGLAPTTGSLLTMLWQQRLDRRRPKPTPPPPPPPPWPGGSSTLPSPV